MKYAYATRHYVETLDGDRHRWPDLVDFDIDRTLADITDDICYVILDAEDFTDMEAMADGCDRSDLAYELAELVAFDRA